jgi:N-methylhydantoinase B/oxoprolinase/acetone carboxylase alpha subunit
VRELRFLAALELSMLTNRRLRAPFGLAGGCAGTPGRNTIIRASGEQEEMPSAFRTTAQPGDRLVVETPGGGGYGTPPATTPG